MRRASLNHNYRLVWSDHANAYVAVAEGTRSRGKSTRASLVAIVIAQLISGTNAYAGGVVVAPKSGGTNVYNAPNGVPVINIDKANAAGLSHNKFIHYNVDINGLVLNNGNSSKVVRDSQLASQVIANTNLAAEAKFILNEVVSPNRTQLSGYTEVLGGKADVIIANPYGITCGGCGFINTDRVTLTTGTPNFLSTGALSGFTVNQGDILISGNGLDGNNQNYFDLIARSIKLEAQINAKELNIVTGNNTWDYGTRNVTANTATGPAPTFALDSTALGGMYANRIFIKATEAGVGVRMLGEAAASASDFTISAAGKIEIKSKVSAERDIALTTTSTVAGAMTLTDAQLTAKRDIALTAQTGNALFNGGFIVASNNLTGIFGSLDDTANTTAVTDNNKRYAAGASNLTVTNATNINGTNWGAKGNLTQSAGSLTIGAQGAAIYSDAMLSLTANTGNLSLGTAAIQAVNNVSLVSTLGNVTTTAGTKQGIRATTGNINVNAQTGMTNTGTISADKGSFTLRANDNSTNSGTIYASTTLDIADKTNTANANFSNSGTLIADDTITAKAKTLTNTSTGSVQAKNGSTVTVTTLSNNGKFIASTATGKSATINVATLTNTGTLQSAKDLSINASSAVTNSGKLLAEDDLTINSTGTGLSVTNQSGGYIQAGTGVGDDLTIKGTAVTLNNNNGGVMLGNTLDLALTSLTNAGTIQSEGNTSYTVTNAVTNTGTLLAKGSLTATSDSLDNSGTLQANTGSTITATNTITNSGKIIGSDSATATAALIAKTLNNTSTGTVQSKQNLSISLSGNTLTNSGKLLADDDLTINAAGTGLTVTNQNGGFIQAGTSAGDDLTIKGTTVTLNNNSGAMILGDALDLSTVSLENAGTTQGGSGASKVSVTNSLTNTGTFNLANTATGSGTITADTINNSGTLQSSGAATLNIASSLINSSNLLTTGALTVRGTDAAYTINNTGRMQSGGLMDVKGKDGTKGVDVTIGESGVIFGNSLDLKASTLTINNGGMLTSTGNLTADLDTLTYSGTKSRIVGSTDGTSTTAITLANEFENLGIVHSGGTLSMKGAGIVNSETGGISGNNVTLSDISYFKNHGAVYAANQVTISTPDAVQNFTTGTIDSGGSISITANSLINNNSINAAQDISIKAANLVNAYVGLENLVRAYEDKITWNEKVLLERLVEGTPPDITEYYEQTGTQREFFVINDEQVFGSPIPAGGIKPQIISGRNMTISGFSAVQNIGGVLAASSGTMNITGDGVFINDDLSLNTKQYKATWNDYFDTSIGLSGTTIEVTRNRSYEEREVGTTSETFGTAGVFAKTLNASGFDLVNKSAAFDPSVTSQTASGSASQDLSAVANGTTGANTVVAVSTASGLPAISFSGLVIALPTNPNGFFVISQNPQSKFLVETNPLFNVGSDYIGSDYMAKRLGLNPDLVGLRLGDAAYEAHLIRQQLIAQTGKNILNSFASESSMMEKLYQNAANASTSLGLKWGEAPSAQQLANLKEDMVWMVQTTVAGKKVLAPVVYLAQATKDNIQSGAVIAADKTNLDLKSVTNTGGTIEGKESLAIKSKGDVTNEGGTIKGGNVSITSTEGSIVNKTMVSGGSADSVAGKKASIESTKNLTLDAKKDITVKGADVVAGGSASLKAGNNITFETVEVNTTTGTVNNGASSSINQGSNLKVGKDLEIASGGNTTIKGSDVDVAGNLKADIKGKFEVLAVQDKQTVSNTTSTYGAGTGGGVYGSETKSTVDFVGTNKGSTLKVGGNMQVKADKATIQGSDVEAGGDLDINAKNGIEILDGLDERSTTTTTTTTAVGVIGSSSDAGAQSDSSAKNKKSSASASANAENNNDVKAVETTKRVQNTTSKSSVASTLKSGGSMSLKAENGTVKVQGSNIDAGGDLDIDAKNVEVLAGRNETTTTDSTEKSSIGMYQENTATAEAGANANGNRGQAAANATANANSTSTFGAQKESNLSTSYSLKNSASTIKSGGNTKIKAQETAKFVGAEVESKGNLAIEAKDIINESAKDIETTSDSKNKSTAGVYVEVDLSADGGAEGDAATSSGAAGGSASAEAGAGLRYKDEKSTASTKKVTNQVSSFKAGGDITRKAANKIVDEGTQLDAGGSIKQTAKIIEDVAIHDEDSSTSSSESIDARAGVTAGASASAQANSSGTAGGDAGAGYGVKASVEGGSASASESSKKAVVSKYKAGKSIESTSTEKTTLVGTVFEAGDKVKIKAGELEYKAAEDTQTSSGKTDDYNVKLEASADSASIEGGYSNTRSKADSTTAKVGKISAGNGIEIETTSGDTTLVGVDLDTKGSVDIQSAGNVNMKSAVSTSSSSDSSLDVSAKMSGSKGGEGEGNKGSGNMKLGIENDSESTKTNTGVKVNASKVNINAKKDVNNESADITSSNQPATVKSEAGKVINTQIKDSATSSSTGVSFTGGAIGKSGNK